MKNFMKILLPVLLLMTGSCARTYQSLSPERMRYPEAEVSDSIAFSYISPVLRTRYHVKEEQKGIKLIAVKCTNRSDRDQILGMDIQLKTNRKTSAPLLNTHDIYKKLHQRSLSNLWMLIFTGLTLNVHSNASGKTSVIPVGLVVGPIMTIGNISTAASANRVFRADLNRYNLMGHTIHKGETVYGLIGIKAYANEEPGLKDSTGR